MIFDSSKRVSINIGIGASSIGVPLAGGTTAFHINRSVISCRIFSAREVLFESTAILSPYSTPFEYVNEAGLEYGLEKHWSHRFYGIVSVGAAYVEGIKRGKYQYTEKAFFGDIRHYEQQFFSTAGVLLESKIVLSLGKYIGLCLNGLANLNSYKSYFGFTSGITFNLFYL